MAIAVLDQAALAAIRGRFEAEFLEDGDPGYDDARKLFNAMIDRKPRLIVRCAGPTDVAVGILLAREFSLPLAIKGGGHGVNGHGVDGPAPNGHGVDGPAPNGHDTNGHDTNGHGTNGH